MLPTDEVGEPDTGDHGQASRDASSEQAIEAARKPAARRSNTQDHNRQPSAVDQLIAQAVELGIAVEDDQSGGTRSTWVNMTEAHDAPTRALLRKLIAMGFEYWPGKGYWR